MAENIFEELAKAKELLLSEHRKWQISNGTKGSCLDFSGADLSGAHFENANFGAANMKGANFYATLLADARFEKAVLANTTFRWVDLVRANVNRSHLDIEMG